MRRTKGSSVKRAPAHRPRDSRPPTLPRCDTSEGVKVRVKRIDNPGPRTSFGFAAGVFAVEADRTFRHARLTLPVDQELIRRNGIDPATLRLFAWEPALKSFRLVRGSAVGPDWRTVSGDITHPAAFTVIGLSANPWLWETVEMFRRFAAVLRIPELAKPFKDRICHLILCVDPTWRRAVEVRGGLAKLGLPDLPGGWGGDICRRCLNLDTPGGRLPEHDILDDLDGRSPPYSPVFDLDVWLTSQPAVASAIVWRAPGATNGIPKPYPTWTPAEKNQLAQRFWQIRQGQFPGLSATPSVTTTLHLSGELFGAGLDPALAWEYFLGYVAQSLAVEIAGWVPWSITAYTPAELEALLDSRSLFEYVSGPAKHSILRAHNLLTDHGAATPGDPVRTFDFLRAGLIIGATRRETVERMLDWCRANLAHFNGTWDPANLQAYWQYQGWPPVERMLAGTTHPSDGFAHWTAGCWGTTGFLRAVLRTANAPVVLVDRCDHALPHFVRDGLYLSHGDDPYNSLARAKPPIPAGGLLIDAATFDAWFGATVPSSKVCDNIGRRVRELAVQYLPNELLRLHCADLAAGRSHAQSDVYTQTGLNRDSTVSDLEAAGLWTRMDAKIAAFGGCGQIPP